MSYVQSLSVSTVGLSRDGFTIKRRNRLDQKLVESVEKLVRTHTNLVLRENLDDTLRNLFPWDIGFVIDETVDDHEEEPEV